MDKEEIDKMTLREVMNLTRDMPIREGGLSIFLEKLVSEIEKIKEIKDE